MKISISDEIKALCPGTALGALHYKVTVEPSSAKLLDIFDSTIAKLSDGNVISILYSFNGREGLKPWIEQFSRNLEQYCGVRGIEIWIV